MTKDDYLKFGEFWQNTHNTMSAGKTFTDSTMQFVFEILEPYPLELIIAATKQHARTEKFAPQPADIITLLNIGNKRPTSDEAWAVIPKDEFSSAWLTDETLAAWAAGASELYKTDKIGARMGFKATYERLCSEAELQGKPINWNFSAGYDENQRREKLIEGHKNGWISKERMTALLPSRKTSTDFGIALIGNAPHEKLKANAPRFKALRLELEAAEAEEKAKRNQDSIILDEKRWEMIQKAQAQLKKQPPQQGI